MPPENLLPELTPNAGPVFHESVGHMSAAVEQEWVALELATRPPPAGSAPPAPVPPPKRRPPSVNLPSLDEPEDPIESGAETVRRPLHEILGTSETGLAAMPPASSAVTRPGMPPSSAATRPGAPPASSAATRPAMPAESAAATAPPKPRSREMNDLVDLGDYSGALEIAEEILRGKPDDIGARTVAETCRTVLRQMYATRIGPLDRVPVVMVPRDQLRWLSIDHKAGFVLSLVDGVSSLEMIIDVSGMPELDTLRILSELAQQRIISLR